MKVATYNIHSCIGTDGRYDPQRICRVLREMEADIIALQEVKRRASDKLDVVEYFSAQLELHAIAGMTMVTENSRYGNVLLSRYPVQSVRRIDLSSLGQEKRGAIDAQARVDGRCVRVIATHLGLKPVERRGQVRQLLDILSKESEADRTIICGDMNDWFLWGRPLRWIREYFGHPSHIRTFPSKFPIFALDTIWCHPADKISNIRAKRSRFIVSASDHLPLAAEICME